MVEIKTLRIWIGVSIAWPLLCLLVFSKWFFLSPLGLIISLGIPIVSWVFWWNCYREEGQKIAFNGEFSIGKSVGFLENLKKRFIN